MNPKDYEDYQKNNVKASKSQLKEYIQVYADMAKKYASTLIKENIDRIQVFSVFRKDEKYGELLNCVCQYSSNTLV